TYMDDRTPAAIAARTTVAAVVGGTASVIGGGKFENGARTAAMAHLLSAETTAGAQKGRLLLI
ncbi:hypothetical protein, partial [Gynuella sp.]|uniref:hypothetical protein n=1 Tax=Gynuella sp. TaxID=2969146 RepID=UPI003D14E2D4